MIKILHVDDERIENILLVRNMGERTDQFEIDWCESATKAVEQLRQTRYDILISDFQMPGMTGLQLLQRIKSEGPDIPFVFLTGQGNEELAIEALREGANDYFIKGGEFAHYERLMNCIFRLVKAEKTRKERKRIESILFELEGRYLQAASKREALQLTDIVNVEDIQKMMDTFHEMTNHPFSIIDLDNNIHVATGWQDVCTKFHRANPETEKLCFNSDKYIAKNLSTKKPVVYTCELGLTDCAIPIIVGEQHVATMFTGQFFLEGDQFDEAGFRPQAKQYGFDEEEYIKAVMKVPRFSKERLELMLSFSERFTKIVSEMGNANLKFARELLERKKNEEKIEKQKDLLAKAQDIGQIGTWELDMGKNILTWTKESCRIFGVPEDSTVDYGIFLSKVHPRDREKVEKAWNKALDGEIYDIEHRLLIGNKVKWVHQKAEIARDKSGKPVSAVGVTQDITEKKLNELKVVESEIRHQKMVSNISDVLVIIDKDGITKYKSPNIERIFGWKPEELIGNKAFITVHPDDLERVSKVFTDLLNSPENRVTLQYRYLCKDGSAREVELTAVNLINDPDINGILANYRDISDKKESEYRYKNLLDITFDGFWVVNTNGEIIQVNESYCSMSGYSSDEILTMRISDIEQHDTKEEIEARIERLIDNGFDRFKTIHRKKNGDLLHLEVSTSFVDINGGQFHVFLKDISTQVEKEISQAATISDFESMFENMVAGVVVHHADTSIAYSNKLANSLLGLGKEEMIGKTAIEDNWGFVDAKGEKLAVADFPVNLIIKSKEELSNYIMGVVKPGEKEPTFLLVNGKPLFNDSGTLQTVIISFVTLSSENRAIVPGFAYKPERYVLKNPAINILKRMVFVQVLVPELKLIRQPAGTCFISP